MTYYYVDNDSGEIVGKATHNQNNKRMTIPNTMEVYSETEYSNPNDVYYNGERFANRVYMAISEPTHPLKLNETVSIIVPDNVNVKVIGPNYTQEELIESGPIEFASELPGEYLFIITKPRHRTVKFKVRVENEI